MKNVISVLCVTLLVAACFAACDFEITIPTPEDRERGRMEQRMSSIRFFKEPESGLCFAYLWVGGADGQGDGGPALSEVPCDKVQNTSKFVK